MAIRIDTTYRAFDLVPIPEDIPELGVKAGDLGVVDFVYDDGRGLHVEIGREDGTSAGFVQLEADEEGTWHVVAYSVFG
jgi:hypothetical protein